ncbi:type II secretion system F family protein [Patescibacteria group bacterium]|nr:type II secretion system F family protein [Patescibacteria group bacterium]MBU1922368.1 type II secretion system F family protein [Patescibacteria group bacterium]
MSHPKTKKTKKPASKPVKTKFVLGWISHLEKTLFAKYLSVMIKSGLTMIEALDISRDQAHGKLKTILEDVCEYVSKGHGLADALERHGRVFPNIYINLIKTGEESGSLAENLRQLSDQAEKDLAIRRKVKSAMMYPVFVLFAATGLGFSMAIFVLPKITQMFKNLDVELPITTRVLMWLADYFSVYGWQTVGVFLVAVVLFGWLTRLPSVKPVLHNIIIRLPIAGKMSRNVNLARFTRTLGITLKSGLTIDEGLKISSDVVDNYVYKRALAQVVKEVKRGSALSESLSAHSFLFPKITTRMTKVGESTGSLEGILIYLAEFYEAEVDNTVKNLATILEPVLLIFLGIMVAIVALAIITPIYQLSGSVG